MNINKGCNDELLVLYHYDELSSSDRRSLDGHLKDCSNCRASLMELQTSLAAVPQSELKFSQAQKLQFAERVAESAYRSSKNYRSVWGGAVAAGILVVTVALLQPTDKLALVVAPTVPSMADFEVLEQLDMLQEIELLKDLDLLQEMENFG